MRIRLGGIVVGTNRRQTVILTVITIKVLVVLYLVSNWIYQDQDGSLIKPTPIGDILKRHRRGNKLGLEDDTQLYDEPREGEDEEEVVQPKKILNRKNKKRPKVEEEEDDADEGVEIIAPVTKPPPKIRMAMEAVKSKRKEILKVQQEIIRNQNRAPDSRYNINVTNSDLQSMDRTIHDTRPPICRTFKYDRDSLPKASVIIPFYNEALSMLLRTIHSVLNRSPDSLLLEVILVDDCSTDLHLQAPLARYVQMLPKVTLVRNDHRQGLIVSRMRGARLSKGQVMIFLDAHSECNQGWLEPLLDEIRRNRKLVLQPFTDAIDAMSLDIGDPGVYHVGSFSWDLRYTWIKLTDHEQRAAHDTGLPFFTPTMVGCAIAVDRDYFHEIGYFDEGLQVWGGENIELGFRTWMCGGKVLTVTCSHVGHVFKEFPYSFDGDKEVIVQKNLIRVAETWMDGMRKYFYASTRIYEFKRAELDANDIASLDERKKIRARLKCQNFDWYLYNVIPQVDRPPMNAQYYGEITSLQSKACWEVTEDYYIGMTYICYHHKIIPKNNFALTVDGLLTYRDKCVTFDAPSPVLALGECPMVDDRKALEAFGIWELVNFSTVQGRIRVKRLSKEGVFEHWCIEQVTNAMPMHRGEQMPQLGTCNEKNTFQTWSFTYGFDFSRVPKEAL